MIVISDASAISALARIKRLELLRLLYEKVLIPNAVYQELLQANDELGMAEAIDVDWIVVEQVKNLVAVRLLNENLDIGESEAIVLALEKNASVLIIDEIKGRRIARSQGLTITGTVGILIAAKRRGLIADVKPILDELITDGFRIGNDLYQSLLRTSNEQG